MKSITKRIVSMIIIFVVTLAFSATAFAASGLNKVNGISRENGGSASFTCTTTIACTRIKAIGTSDNNNSLHVFLTITGKKAGRIVDQKEVILNGVEQNVITYGNGTGSLPVDTYTINVRPAYGYTDIGYEVSTLFYSY